MMRFSTEYTSDRQSGWTADPEIEDYVPCFTHTAGSTDSLQRAKAYITRIRRENAGDHPRDFRILDHWGGDGHGPVPVVYQEA